MLVLLTVAGISALLLKNLYASAFMFTAILVILICACCRSEYKNYKRRQATKARIRVVEANEEQSNIVPAVTSHNDETSAFPGVEDSDTNASTTNTDDNFCSQSLSDTVPHYISRDLPPLYEECPSYEECAETIKSA